MNVLLLPDEEYNKLVKALDGEAILVLVPRSAMDQFAAEHGLTTGEVMELAEDTDFSAFSVPDVMIDLVGYDHKGHIAWRVIDDAIKEAV
jgi:hypothetical protein